MYRIITLDVMMVDNEKGAVGWGWGVMRQCLFSLLCSLQRVAYDPHVFEDTLKSFANKVSVE